MKKFLFIIVGILIVLAGCKSPLENIKPTGTTPTQIAGEYVEGQMIVCIEPGSKAIKEIETMVLSTSRSLETAGGDFEIINAIADNTYSKSAFTMNEDFKSRLIQKMGHVYTFSYKTEKYADFMQAKEALQSILASQGFTVRYIEPNYILHAIEMPVSSQTIGIKAVHPNQEWHYNMIKAPEAWNITTGSSETKMAVLDTGIDNTHPALTNFVNMELAKSFVGGNTMDKQGHGTHVAGTIASYGPVSGVMQNAMLIPVKVLNDQGSGTLDGITQGIIYAAKIKADVINMSLGGGGFNQSMNDACEFAVKEGTIVVAAAGNDGKNQISYPAAYASVIAVGSVTKTRERSSFSNYGNGLDVMAPGSDIYSTKPNNSYATHSGTSMATPHAVGVLGLMRSAKPGLPVARAREILKATAQNAGPALYYGSGIVDAYAAVQAALDDNWNPPPPPPPPPVTTEGAKPPVNPSNVADDPGSAVYPFTSYQRLTWTTAVEKRPVEAYIPAGANGKLPVLVWMGGKSMQTSSYYKATLEHIVKKGIVVVIVEADSGSFVFGNADHVKPARAINEAATESIAKINVADASRIFYAGHSLGAKCSVIAAALATTLDTGNKINDPQGLILFAFDNSNGGPFANPPDNNNPANGYAAKIAQSVSITIIEYEDDTIAGPGKKYAASLYAKTPSLKKQHILVSGSKFKTNPALEANHNTVLTSGFVWAGGDPVLNALDWFNSWRFGAGIPLAQTNNAYIQYVWGELRTHGGTCDNGAILRHTVVSQNF